jgi:hypothetical protein
MSWQKKPVTTMVTGVNRYSASLPETIDEQDVVIVCSFQAMFVCISIGVELVNCASPSIATAFTIDQRRNAIEVDTSKLFGQIIRFVV